SGLFLTYISQSIATRKAISAWHGPIQHHAITREDAAYARTGFEYNSRSFVPHDSLGRTREHLMIRMAHAAGLDLYQHFAQTGITNIYLIDFEIPLPIGD